MSISRSLACGRGMAGYIVVFVADICSPIAVHHAGIGCALACGIGMIEK